MTTEDGSLLELHTVEGRRGHVTLIIDGGPRAIVQLSPSDVTQLMRDLLAQRAESRDQQ